MKDQPQISVIIPCYNQARFLPETLESVLSQENVKLQVIVVDDGSIEDIAGVCSRYGDRVLYIRQENQGAAVARNRGLSHAFGEFIYFLDGDDKPGAGSLARMQKVLQANPEWAAVICSLQPISVDGITGILVEEGDWESQSRAFVRLCQERQTLADMAAASHERAARLFGEKAEATNLLRILEECR